MARENSISLRGLLEGRPKITTNQNGKYALVTVKVVRPDRPVGDGISYVASTHVRIMTQDSDIIDEMSTWEKWDIVEIKGVLSSKKISKVSYCPHCKKENHAYGSLVYVVPTFAEKVTSMVNDQEGLQYLIKKREVSNIAKMFGTLWSSPKMLSTFSGIVFTQFQLAVNRKLRIKEDDPFVKTDFPWVKTYGDVARVARNRLIRGSEVYIDGCLQSRDIPRTSWCGQARDANGDYMRYQNGNPVIEKDADGNDVGCGQEYIWNDRTLEIVPFSIEMVSNFLSEEEALHRAEMRRADSARSKSKSPLFATDVFDQLTKEDYENGIDDADDDYRPE